MQTFVLFLVAGIGSLANEYAFALTSKLMDNGRKWKKQSANLRFKVCDYIFLIVCL